MIHLYPCNQDLWLNWPPSTEGAVKLSFESSLTLKDVEGRNKGVSEGEYEPSDCTARQSVAVLIPHRSRERHLLYLLNHLHPFLQRQQLHYAIYVIQQVATGSTSGSLLPHSFNTHLCFGFMFIEGKVMIYDIGELV